MTRIKYGFSREVRVMCLGEREYPTEILNSPDLIVEHWWACVTKALWYDREKEMAVVIALNRKNRHIGFALVSVGTANTCLIHPREVFRPAVAMGATGLVLCHNHPTGDPAPSQQDVLITRQLIDAAFAIDIDLIDHVIIGSADVDPCKRGFYSFREAGVIGPASAPLPPKGKRPQHKRADAKNSAAVVTASVVQLAT